MSGPSQIPPSWALANVGDVCLDLQYGYTASASVEPCGPRFLRITDIQEGRVNWPSVPYCSIERGHIDKYALRDGDIVFARTGGTVGKSFIITGVPEPTVFASYLIRLSSHCAIAPAYLYYFFQSLSYWEQIGLKKGGLQGNVNATTLSSLELPICPTKEQYRIVVKIEELFSELDKGLESLAAVREQLKGYRQAVLKHAFEGNLTANWRSKHAPWRQTCIGDEIDFLTSGSRGWAEYYSDQGEIFIRAQNLKHDRLDLTDIAFVKLPGNAEGVRTRVQVGDVLITITGANVTKTGILETDIGTAYVSQHVALCRPGPSIMPEFLYWYLISETGGRRQLNKAAYGAGKPGLNLDNIREVTIALPHVDEQAQIVGLINSAISIEENLRASIHEELSRASALGQAILKKAFSGHLVAQDPNDEHASVLLERIRTEGSKDRKNNKGNREAA